MRCAAGTTWHGTAQLGVTWRGMAQYGFAWRGIAQCGPSAGQQSLFPKELTSVGSAMC